MPCAILTFLFCIVLPVGGIVWLLPGQARQPLEIAALIGAAGVLGIALAIRLLARERPRGIRLPNPRVIERLAWPASVTRGQMEELCLVYLRNHGWTTTRAVSPAADGTLVVAAQGDVRAILLCDLQGEELNPATIRAFALAAAAIGGTHPVLVTLTRGKLPRPAETAAREAGVRLLRVADLAGLSAALTAPAALPAPVSG